MRIPRHVQIAPAARFHLHPRATSSGHIWRKLKFILGTVIQWIGLRDNLQESPIFNGKIYGFL